MIKLNNGIEMPQMGYGVYQVTPEECERCVLDAIGVGYRMIDTAQAYHNEEAVGSAWKKSGVSRDELFLVSKVWISNYGEGQTLKSIDESLRKLKTDYIDLMLLHQPFCDRYGAYRDLEKAYKAGKLRSIGVSNFYPAIWWISLRIWRLCLWSIRWNCTFSTRSVLLVSLWMRQGRGSCPGVRWPRDVTGCLPIRHSLALA